MATLVGSINKVSTNNVPMTEFEEVGRYKKFLSIFDHKADEMVTVSTCNRMFN